MIPERRDARQTGDVIGAIAVVGLLVWWCVPELVAIAREDALLASCVRTHEVEVARVEWGGYGPSGYAEVSFVFRTAEGRVVESTQSIRVPYGRRPDLTPASLSVCYASSDPTRVVLEPFRAMREARWASLGFTTLLWVFALGVGLYVHRKRTKAVDTPPIESLANDARIEARADDTCDEAHLHASALLDASTSITEDLLDVTSRLPRGVREPSLVSRVGLVTRVLAKSLAASACLIALPALGGRQARDAVDDARAYSKGRDVEAGIEWTSRSTFGLLPTYELTVTPEGVAPIALRFDTLYAIDLSSDAAQHVRYVEGEHRFVPYVMAHALVARCLWAVLTPILALLLAGAFANGTPRLVARLRSTRDLARRARVVLVPEHALHTLPAWTASPDADLSASEAPFVVTSRDGTRFLLVALDDEAKRFAFVSFEGVPFAIPRDARAALRSTLQGVVGATNAESV